MERNDGVRRFLLLAPVYQRLQRAIGGQKAVDRVSSEVIRSTSQTAIVEIGCGTAEIVPQLPFSSYVGFDPNPNYVADATRRLAGTDHAKVFVGRIGDPELQRALPAQADVAMAIGVLHHLDDVLADSALALAADLVGSGGRFVSMDPCFVDGQPRVARFLASRDRGRHVRSPAALEELVRRRFKAVQVDVHNDMLRIPYTHVTVEASDPR